MFCIDRLLRLFFLGFSDPYRVSISRRFQALYIRVHIKAKSGANLDNQRVAFLRLIAFVTFGLDVAATVDSCVFSCLDQGVDFVASIPLKVVFPINTRHPRMRQEIRIGLH